MSKIPSRSPKTEKIKKTAISRKKKKMYYCYDKISKEFPISAFANMCKNILDVISCKKFH